MNEPKLPKQIYFMEPVIDNRPKKFYRTAMRRLYSSLAHAHQLRNANTGVVFRIWKLENPKWELIDDSGLYTTDG